MAVKIQPMRSSRPRGRRQRRPRLSQRTAVTRRHRFEALEQRLLLAVGPDNLTSGEALLTYRLALATTAEFSQRVCEVSTTCDPLTASAAEQRSATSQTLDAINAQVNSVFQRELAIGFELIPDNDALISTGDPGADNYTNANVSALYHENGPEIERRLTTGAGDPTTGPGQRNAYDVGHVLGVGSGGGLAGLGVAGRSGKAQGVTTTSTPVALDDNNAVVASSSFLGILLHELAHQFGAEHTFNGVEGSCLNRTPESAYEPGSGSTIMGYQWLCGTDNLAFEAGDERYFHAASFDEIHRYIDRSIPDLRPAVATGNRLPQVEAGGDLTIPANTPFILTAFGSDPDAGDALLYTWEQMDFGPNHVLISSQPLTVAGNPAEENSALTSLDRASDEYSFFSGDVIPITGTRPDGGTVSGSYTYAAGDTVADLIAAVNGLFNSPASGGATMSLAADGSLLLSANELHRHYPNFQVAFDSSGPPQLMRFTMVSRGQSLPVPPGDDASGPLFRSFAPTSNPSRTFPRLQDLAADSSPASYLGEQLPTTGRELNFRVTVRDQHATDNGVVSGVRSDDVRLTVHDTGEAFQVTGLAGDTTWDGGSTETVTWSVAGTTANGIATQRVNLWLSTDGGSTFPISLGSFANDGSANITVPALSSTTNQARVMVEAAGNVFFDISDHNFTVNVSNVPAVRFERTGDSSMLIESAEIMPGRYQVSLQAPPETGQVTVAVTADSQSQVSLTGSPGSFSDQIRLHFSDASSQTVFVRALDDATVEATHTTTLSHSVVFTEDAVHYPETLSLPTLDWTIVDNDAAATVAGNGQLVGIDFDPGSGTTPSNWTRAIVGSSADPPGLENLVDESGTTTGIGLMYLDSSGSGSSTPQSNSLPTHASSLDALDGVLFSGSFNGEIDPIDVTWTGLTPGAEYDVYVFGLENFAGSYSQRISIFGDGSPVVFDQITSDGVLLINDEAGSSERTLESYAERAVATEFGTLRVRAEALAGSEGIVLAGLALQEIIPATTIDAFDASGLVGSETDSGSPSFSFTLTRSGDTSASATVDYQVSGRGGNPVDANDFGGVFPSGQVTFQAGQAVSDPVSINVAGDTTDEADERFSVLFSQPSDGARLAVQSVPGTVIDDDETLAGVALGVAPERVTEAGNEELIYTFTRDHVDGSLQVNFTVGGTAVAGTDYNVTGATAFGTGSGSVTFADGDPVVEIRIAAVDDGLAENDESIAISLQDGSGYLADATPVRSTIGGDVTSHTIGFYQPDVSLFHLKETFTAGASDQYFAFGPGGNAGWIPLVGDWNGDGLDTIGLYQPSISLFHLKDTFTPGASDQYFAFGPGGAGWIPLAGDWDGDGVDTIGLYQPDASIFHLKDSFAPGASDHYFAFGPGGAGWTPLVGDWDGDGSDGIGFYQPDSSLFHLKDSFGSGASDQYFAFGPGGAGWTPLVGDWNGDRTDTIGLYQPDLSLFHLKDSFTPGASDQYFAFGPAGAGWTPLSGDWNGPAAATSPSGAKPVPSDAPTLSSPTARRTLSVSPEAAEGERPDRFGPTLTRSVTASRPSPSGFEASDGRTRGQTARFPGANSAAREASGRSQAALIDQALLLLQEEGSLSAG